MLKAFPFKSLAVGVAVAAADGLAASYDIGKGGAPAGQSPPLLKSKALWVQGGALGIGIIGEVAGWHPDITEPLMIVPAALAAREVAFHFAQARETSPASTQGYRAYVPQGAVAAPFARPALGDARAWMRKQEATALG